MLYWGLKSGIKRYIMNSFNVWAIDVQHVNGFKLLVLHHIYSKYYMFFCRLLVT